MLSAYSSEYLQTNASDVWELFFETHLILDIQITFTLCKGTIAKTFKKNCNKNESLKPYLGNKEQKLLFLVVSQLDLGIDFVFARPLFLFNFVFFASPRGRANEIAYPKNRVHISNFVQSLLSAPSDNLYLFSPAYHILDKLLCWLDYRSLLKFDFLFQSSLKQMFIEVIRKCYPQCSGKLRVHFQWVFSCKLLLEEAVTRRCSIKWIFLMISQN